MKWLPDFSLKNPTAIVLLVLLVAMGGVYSVAQFKQEQLPDITIPGIVVSTVYPGAAPHEVLTHVTMPLEKALRNIEGVKNITSQSANSVSVIELEFGYGEDMKLKKAEVKEVLSGVSLPDEAEQPEVMGFSSTGQPIMYTAVKAGAGITQQELWRLVRNDIIPALQNIEGVADVQAVGLETSGVYIRVDAGKLAAHQLTYDQVLATLQMNNLGLPLGEVTMERNLVPVFLQGGINTVAALERLVVDPVSGITLGDIADIGQRETVPVLNYTNGSPSVTLNILKTPEADTVAVANRVLEIYADAERGGKVETLIMYNRAADVEESVGTLAREGLLGALFASVMILLFLRNGRATLIAVVSIPLSMLTAMILLKSFTDVTLNIMTLGGLAVATGRVVDDSIVVIENIMRRLQREKLSRELIVHGTMEVGKAITSSTLTTVAVFAPLAFVQGIVGEFFRPFAWTVTFALLASLAVALTVVPLTAWLLMRKQGPKARKEWALSRRYKTFLRWSLDHKATVLVAALLLFIGSLAPLFTGAVGVTLLPETNNKYLFAALEMPKGTDAETLRAEAERVDAVLRADDRVTHTNMTVGGSFTGGESAGYVEWFVGLTPDTNLDAFINDMSAGVNPPEGGAFSMIKDDLTSSGIAITVTGTDTAEIRAAAEMITEAIRRIDGTDNVGNNLQDGGRGIAIELRQQDAARYGLTAAQASALIRPLLAELPVGRLGEGDEAVEMYLALDGATLASPGDVADLPLSTPYGSRLAVKDIADVKEVELPDKLLFKNGAEYALVTADITAKDVGKVNREVRNALAALELPGKAKYSLGGSDAEIRQMMSDMLMAMAVAVGMVYIVMVVTFREGRAPLAILFSLPFALTGGLVGTLLTGEPISVSSMIGFLMLIGIVVTNAIVLVERVQQQMAQGATIRDALIEAGGTRLRPILMTAVATICALAPLAAGLGGGLIVSGGLAVVVIGGLIGSTLLTLVIVPVVYELLYFKRSRRQRDAAAAGAVAGAA
jgi:HAE1 family hydrophobic/amphiphilic exporter-1